MIHDGPIRLVISAPLLGTLLLFGSVAGAEGPPRKLALIMAQTSCPDAKLSAHFTTETRKWTTSRGGNGMALLPMERPTSQPASVISPAIILSPSIVGAALSRTRTDRALKKAQQLYTRTDFSSCIALLSITEQELGRNLADSTPAGHRRAHQLLAQVNLWLGICQWAIGDPQVAATSFRRSAQFATPPLPDPELLPPELVAAYRTAIAAPRQDVTCTISSSLIDLQLSLDGAPLPLENDSFRTSAGMHYLTFQATCRRSVAATSRCFRAKDLLGQAGLYSMRLEASATHCHIDHPHQSRVSPISCLSFAEAEDASLLQELVQEAGADEALLLVLRNDRLALRLLRAERPVFVRQLASQLEPGEDPTKAISKSISMLWGEALPPLNGSSVHTSPWYKKWWIWVAIGTAVAVATTTVLVTRSPDRVQVVFGR